MTTLFMVTSDGNPLYVTTTEDEAKEWRDHEIRHREKERIPVIRIFEMEPTTTAPPFTSWFLTIEQTEEIKATR